MRFFLLSWAAVLAYSVAMMWPADQDHPSSPTYGSVAKERPAASHREMPKEFWGVE